MSKKEVAFFWGDSFYRTNESS